MCSMPLEEDSYGENKMTYQEQTLLLIKGHITTLSPEQQSVVSDCAATIRDVLAKHPDGEGLTALALVGAEIELDTLGKQIKK